MRPDNSSISYYRPREERDDSGHIILITKRMRFVAETKQSSTDSTGQSLREGWSYRMRRGLISLVFLRISRRSQLLDSQI